MKYLALPTGFTTWLLAVASKIWQNAFIGYHSAEQELLSQMMESAAIVA